MPKLPQALRKPAKPGESNGSGNGAGQKLKESPADLVGWVDERTGATGFLTGMLFRKVPKGTNWFYTLGSATLFAFVVAGGHRSLPGDVLHAVAHRGLRLDHATSRTTSSWASSSAACTSGAPR